MPSIKSAGGLNPDDGFPPVFVDVSTKLGRYDNYMVAARGIAQHFPPDQFNSVLDICCGPGHFANSLFHEGYKVRGIDLSKPQIIDAQTKYKDVNFCVADMANLPNGQFDLLTNVYTSFGYLETQEQDMSLLKHWFSRLRPGGVLLMELADMSRARNRIPESGKLTRQNNDVVEELEFDWNNNILAVKYIKPDGASWQCYTRIYETDTLVDELHKAGFSDVEYYGDFHKKAKEDDDNLVIFAVKP